MPDRHFQHWPPGRPHSLPPPETTLYENLCRSVERSPERAAIVYYDTVISYGEMIRDVEALAGFLRRELGAGKDDRVLLYMQNAPQYIIGFYAILRAGCVVVPANPMCLRDELRHVIDDSGAKIGICTREVADNLVPLLDDTDLEQVVVADYRDYLRVPTELELPECVDEAGTLAARPGVHDWTAALAMQLEPPAYAARVDDWCVIPYSSGTTGQPKGCLHTHRSVNSVVAAYIRWFELPADMVSLVCLPMFHVTGMQNSMNVSIAHGATMVVMTRWNRRVAAKLIERYRVTNWRSITAMAIDLLSDTDLDPKCLSSLKSIGGGGAAMPEAVARRLEEVIGLPYIEGYGLTEVISATHINPPQAAKPQCLGIPIFDVDSRVVDPDTHAELGVNEVGEIIINAPQVFQGYWNNVQATREAFLELDGKAFFRTGDLGYHDEGGYFFMVDRLKRMIDASGYNVWPAEVEALMHGHPDIGEVCVVAAADARRGETVKAMVVSRQGAKPDAAAIADWCREHMAAYKVPRVIEFTDSLPHSGSGKVLWREVQQRERERAASE